MKQSLFLSNRSNQEKQISQLKTRNSSIQIFGANENNLKKIDVEIPKNKLVVITGVSGSGKSSLAFDTIYAEGQRRYLETFSAYARQFIGKMERPDVEKIDGLSPVISIEQKTTGWNPRSTVGTTTEIYDFLRLLFARASNAYSYVTGKRMQRFTEEKIIASILEKFDGKKIMILSRLVDGRKGHYRELFEQLRKQGYTKCLVDNELMDLIPGLQVERYKTHTIELIVDRIKVESSKAERMKSSVTLALKKGGGVVFIMDSEKLERKIYSKRLMDPDSGISYAEPSPHSFSFNSPQGACTECKGLGTVQEVDLEKLIPDDTKSLNLGGIAPIGERRENTTFKQLQKLAKKYKFSLATPIKDIPAEGLNVILHGGDESIQTDGSYGNNDFHYNLPQHGILKMVKRWYSDTNSDKIRTWAEDFMTVSCCPECLGARIRKESLYFKLDNKNIAELSQMDLVDLGEWLSTLDSKLTKKQGLIAKDIIKELRLRVQFLLDVGLDYLHLHRPTRSLSGGESQRTRLATQIGSKLTGITYILDEPSIGLHQRDNQRLIAALRDLVDIGNSVIVVEHDKDIMLASDFIIDLGPGAGEYGGEIVAQGPPDKLMKFDSLTVDYLKNKKKIAIPETRRKGKGESIILKKATGNNLKAVDIKIPLGTFCCVTGVSGSGKSSLITSTLYPVLKKKIYGSNVRALPYGKISGTETIDKVIEIDQSPIGRTPRSNPATYTGVFTDIRKLFALVPEAKIRGYKIGRFSFNVKGGRCETCQGSGRRVIEMNFLPNVHVDCEDCNGRRYNRETLQVIYKGKSISDVLEMSVTEAVIFFEKIPSIYRKLAVLQSVGLGYITLGQQATTLSGGEAQRVKLSEELSKRATGNTFYILDEPTTGLHFRDIQLLLNVLDKLVEKGNTVLVIEHNLDVVKVADYIIDLGPEGGKNGGYVLFQGTPEAITKCKESLTGQYLKKEM